MVSNLICFCFIMFYSGTQFEFTYCQAEKCFMDMPARSKAKPLPETLLRGQRVAAPNEMTTISSVSGRKSVETFKFVNFKSKRQLW